MIQGFSSSLIGNRELIYETDLPSFQRDFASLKTLDHGYGPSINFTRASNATFFDVDGVLRTAGNNVPRFDHDAATGSSLGLLIEEARTNSIRNSQAGGATNGVIGSGGALPTHWNFPGLATVTSHGVVLEVISSGTESGLAYIDLKISGTPSGSETVFIAPDSIGQVVAADAQSWTFSAYVKLQGGTASNAIFRRQISGFTSANAGISGQSNSVSFTPTSASLATQRSSLSVTFSNATVARTMGFVSVAYTSGQQIGGSTDGVTLRIAAPQLEQGAFPTSYIPTTTAAATRSADSAVVTPISSFYNQAEGTLFAEHQRYATANSSFVGYSLHTDAQSGTDQIVLAQAASPSSVNTIAYLAVSTTGQTTRETFVGGLTMGQVTRLIGGIKSGEFFVGGRSEGGSFVSASNANAHTLIAATRLALGAQASGSARLNGHIRKIAYYPRRLSNTLLQQLTT